MKKGDKLETSDITFGQDPLLPFSYYKGNIFLVGRHTDMGHGRYEVNYAWHPIGGTFELLRAATVEEEKK